MSSASQRSSTADPADWIESAALEAPGRPFLRLAGAPDLSYGALLERSGRHAAALAQRGVVEGERVLVQVEKSTDAVILYAACLRLGAIYVPLNTASTSQELEYFLRDAQPRIFVVRPADARLLQPLAEGAGVGAVETLGADGSGTLIEAAAALTAASPRRRGDAAAVAAIVYTSGTTGRSKGAMLTRGNLGSNAAALAAAWRFSAADVLLHTLPLFHIHGLFAAINTVLISRSSVLMLAKFEAEKAIASMPQATVYMGVPTHYMRFLSSAALNREKTAGMRLFVSGSAPLLAQTHQEFAQRTGHAILERYGMTETLINASNPYEGARKPGTVGPALSGISIRIMSTDLQARERAARQEPAGVTGALEVKGPNVFAGYWRAPDKTRAEFTQDGWFKTGDLGLIDEEGYVHIVGRAKDLVISGGYNVYPKEVEREIDALEGVLESAVFGVPHPDLGEGVTAAVVRRGTTEPAEAEILAALRARLARYKIPRRVLIVEELPRNTMGKVQKNVLRATYATLYSPDPTGAPHS